MGGRIRFHARSFRYAIALALVSALPACGESEWALGIPSGAVGPGRIAGMVTKGNAGVSGLRIVLVGRDSTLTDENGAYLFDLLPPKFYTLNLRLPQGESLESGYSTIRNANVGSGKTAEVDWRLNSGIPGGTP